MNQIKLKTQSSPIPEDEIFFQITTESYLKSTWIRVPRKVVSLVWNLGESRAFNRGQKAALISALRNIVDSRGQLIIKSARYDDMDRNIIDLRLKLTMLVMTALSGKAIEAHRKRSLSQKRTTTQKRTVRRPA